MITSEVSLPFFPASFHNAGTVPAIHPTKNHNIVVSYAPNKKLTKKKVERCLSLRLDQQAEKTKHFL